MDCDAIVPAYNEARTVGDVVRVLRACPGLARVLVVDDGSTDATAEVARAAGAEVLSLAPNRGKGGAMRAGLEATRAPLVFFCDADLVGLDPAHVAALLAPVAAGSCRMAVGLRDYGTPWNELQRALPLISGERCLERAVAERVPPEFWQGFRTEVALDVAAGAAICTVPLTGLSIVPKWAKGGDPRAGFTRAISMVGEILVALRDAQTVIHSLPAP